MATLFRRRGSLTIKQARPFFAAQTYCGVADGCGNVIRLYILHPNSIGRWAGTLVKNWFSIVSRRQSGMGLVFCRLTRWLKTTFTHATCMSGWALCRPAPCQTGLRMKDGSYQNICLYYHEVSSCIAACVFRFRPLRSHFGCSSQASPSAPLQ